MNNGYYNDPLNWVNGVVPTNGDIGNFSGAQNYVVRFPAGGLVENSTTKIEKPDDQSSVTFDTRGTWWLKSGCDGWPNYWTGFQILSSGRHHFFNIEGLLESAANNYPILEMSNALFRVQYAPSNITIVLEEGLLNLYNPGDVVRANHSLITGYGSPANNLILFKDKSTLRANKLFMRGPTEVVHHILFEGGQHEIFDGVVLGERYADPNANCVLEVAGGELAIRDGNLVICEKATAEGTLKLTGEAMVSLQKTLYTSHNTSDGAANSLAFIQLKDNSRLNIGGNLLLGCSEQAQAEITLEDETTLNVNQTMVLAESPASEVAVNLASEACLTVMGTATVANTNNASGKITLEDQATGLFHNRLVIGDQNGTGDVAVRDAASLTVTGGIVLAGDNGSDSRGTLDLANISLQARSVCGGVGARERGGNGWAEVTFNGTTWQVCAAPDSGILLQDLDLAQLASDGLILDTAGHNVTINQTFTEAPGVSAQLMKTGSGTLKLSNNEHTFTVVNKGTLQAIDAHAVCGRHLTIANNATLSLQGTPENLTVGDLTLGIENGAMQLILDANDYLVVTGTLDVAQCFVNFGGAAVSGVYTLLRSQKAINPSVATKFFIGNPADNMGYTFSHIQDGTDDLLQLTIFESTSADVEWDGAINSNWHEPANWQPNIVPAHTTKAKFGAEASEKLVVLNAQGYVNYMEFDSEEAYTLNGSHPLILSSGTIEAKTGSHPLILSSGTIEAKTGDHNIDLPLVLASDSVLTIAEDVTTISGPVSSFSPIRINKNGSGIVELSGDNSNLEGTWLINGGQLTFASPLAWGNLTATPGVITLGAGTLCYSGIPTAISRELLLDTGDNQKAAILNMASDLTLNGSLDLQSGIFCKRGSGTLTLNVDNGEITLSVGNGSGGVNKNPSGAIVFPEGGDAPAEASGLAGFNVLEGALRVRGNGPNVSLIKQKHFGVIGGDTHCSADPVLELDNIKMDQGGSGVHLLIGNQMSHESMTLSPTLRLLNNALVTSDTVKVGFNTGMHITPRLIMTNSTLSTKFLTEISTATAQTPHIVRLADGSHLMSAGDNVNGGGIYFNRQVDMLVTASTVSQTAPGGDFRFNDKEADGVIRFEQGSTLRFARLQGFNHATKNGLNLVFDNATIEPLFSGSSISTKADKQSVIIEEGNLTVLVGAEIQHEFTFPLTGSGSLFKTGSGELVFGPGLEYTPNGNNLTGLTTGNYSGETFIQEGTLSVSYNTIRDDAAVHISPEGTLNLSSSLVSLGSISGNGTITDGDLLSDYRCYVDAKRNDRIAFDNVVLPQGLDVYFDSHDESVLTNRQVLAVATRMGTSELNLTSWKAHNVGDKLTAYFSLEDDTVYAHIAFHGGTILLIR